MMLAGFSDYFIIRQDFWSLLIQYVEKTENKMSNRRNQPCSCGSGIKFKKCCGLIREVIVGSSDETSNNRTGEVLSASEYYRMAEDAINRRQLDKAAGYLRHALRIKSDFLDALNRLGVVHLTLGRPEEAVVNFRRLAELKPDEPEAHFNLGIALYDSGRLDEAVESFQRLIELKPDHVEAHFNLGNFFMAQGKQEEAVSSFNRALELKPDYAEARCNLGVLYKELGKTEDAVACFKQALFLKPDYVRAFKGLSLVGKYTEADEFVQKMQDLYNRKNISGPDRKDLGFALGKVYEDLGDFDKSFAFIFEANRLKRQSYQYTIQKDYELFVRIKKIFSPEFFTAHQGIGHKDKTPIFILGMPRSGTTLVEQILASHPLVFGAGELPVLVDLTNTLCVGAEKGKFPECMLHMDAATFAGLGSQYIKNIRKYSTETEYITDKMPHNFLRLGLIKTILPNAKVIHCRRNPMDTCFSIFKMDFTTPHGYAYDLVELGRYYSLYQDLMAFWEKVLPGFMYTIRYEEVVADQRAQTESLLEFCNLPWDQACIDFYKTKRRVSTASLAQVRQPIYKDSVKLWKRYEKQLEPLRKAIYENKQA